MGTDPTRPRRRQREPRQVGEPRHPMRQAARLAPSPIDEHEGLRQRRGPARRRARGAAGDSPVSSGKTSQLPARVTGSGSKRWSRTPWSKMSAGSRHSSIRRAVLLVFFRSRQCRTTTTRSGTRTRGQIRADAEANCSQQRVQRPARASMGGTTATRLPHTLPPRQQQRDTIAPCLRLPPSPAPPVEGQRGSAPRRRAAPPGRGGAPPRGDPRARALRR